MLPRVRRCKYHRVLTGAGNYLQCSEIVRIAGISEQVKIDYVCSGILNPVQHKVGANKSRAAGDQIVFVSFVIVLEIL